MSEESPSHEFTAEHAAKQSKVVHFRKVTVVINLLIGLLCFALAWKIECLRWPHLALGVTLLAWAIYGKMIEDPPNPFAAG